jgi:hypothetical protein
MTVNAFAKHTCQTCGNAFSNMIPAINGRRVAVWECGH